MSERTILQITGEAGAGKTDICAHLAQKYGFTVIRVSDLIRSFAGSKNWTLGSRSDYLRAHKQMKDERGVGTIAQEILDKPANRLCVDGIRVVNDVERLRKAPGAVSRVIALHCPPEIRFKRALLRNSGVDKLTLKEFVEDDCQDARNTDLECPNTTAVMDAADYHIDAAQPQNVVFATADKLVEAILAELR